MTNRNIYTVKQINSYVKRLFEEDFILRSVSVRGEISNCKYHYSGHIYFSLKDESGVISAVMFAGNAKSLKFRLEDGKQVVVTGSVTVYERDGRYQLYARSIEEDGQGDLARQFEELKKRLEESGMFDASYKQPIPPYAMHIGVVTAETGAVIRDIYNVASRRNPYCQITLYPAQVQGQGAAETIVRGIETLDNMGLDVIIVGRGGGSMEDLWCFNDENVARAIFNAQTPVISAVGHETDFTIADFVADLRAPTPSAAAELAVFDYGQLMDELEKKKTQLRTSLNHRLAVARARVNEAGLKLRLASPQSMIDKKRQFTDSLLTELMGLMDAKVRARRDRLGVLAERLSGLSPLDRLKQGYAFAADEQGHALKSISNVSAGQNISIGVADGFIDAQVTGTHGRDY